LQYAFDASTKWLRNGNPLNVHNKQLIRPGAGGSGPNGSADAAAGLWDDPERALQTARAAP
jgi:hypothetical protein